MRTNERLKKVLSILLALTMVVGYIPAPAFAVEADTCTHHTEHTAECGYASPVAGSPCTHAHSGSCYTRVACTGEHEGDCTAETGCVTMELDCRHTHGDCGYAEEVAPQNCTTCQPTLTHVPGCGYVAPVAEQTCTCTPGEDGNVTHIEGCGYAAPVEEVKCACVPAVTHGGEGCTYAEGKAASPCTHVCSVEAGCYKLLYSHSDGGHDDTCGYAPASEGSPCTYECSEEHTTETTAPTETTVPETTVVETEPVCICESACGGDNGIDPNCAVCLEDFWNCAHFDPTVCTCTEKCTEETVNYWCPVCGAEGADLTACTGKDTAAAYDSCICTIKCIQYYVNSNCTVCNSAFSDCTGGNLPTNPTISLSINGAWVVDQNGQPSNMAQSGDDWSFDASTSTLTLTNATLGDSSSGQIPIKWGGGNLTIVLEGANTINASSSGVSIFDDSYSGSGTLTITGEGTLTCLGRIYSSYSDMAFRIENTTVTATYIRGSNLTISGSKVTADGSEWAGLYAEGIMTIENSTVEAKSNYSDSGGYGIQSGDSLTITGSTVTATGSNDGIASSGGISISGSNVTATGSNYGIYSNSSLTVSNSRVEASGTEYSDIYRYSSSGNTYTNSLILTDDGADVYGEVTLTAPLTINEGQTLNIPEGAKLTIAEGVTLTNKGTRTGDGTLTCQKHTMVGNTCTVCGLTCDHSGNTNPDDGSCTTAVTCSICGGTKYAAMDAHTWASGKCTNTLLDGTTCSGTHTHAETDWENGTCKGCGYVCTHTDGEDSTWDKGTCTVCGAAHAHADEDWNNGTCSVCGMTALASVTVGGTTTWYTDEALLRDAVVNGASVKLYSTVELTTPMEISGTVTIDLNGHTLKNAESFSGDNLIEVAQTGALTINDSSEGNGTVSMNQGEAAICVRKGCLTITGGNYSYTGTDEYGKVIDASIYSTTEKIFSSATITGGSFKGVIWVFYNNMSISGGTFDTLNIYDTTNLGLTGTSDNLTGGTFGTIIDVTQTMGLSNALGTDCYYWTDGKIVIPAANATELTNVTVAKETEHNWQDGVCQNGCGKVCDHTDSDGNSAWVDGTCSVCGKVCDHGGENLTYTYAVAEDGKSITAPCDTCGAAVGTLSFVTEVEYDGHVLELTDVVSATGIFADLIAKESELADEEKRFALTYCCANRCFNNYASSTDETCKTAKGCKNAGNHNLTLTFTDGDNSYSATDTVTVTPKALTISSVGFTKYYDGTANVSADDLYGELEGFVKYSWGDSYEVYDAVGVEIASGVLPGTTPGTYTSIELSGITLTRESAGNYTIASTATLTGEFTIDPMPLTITPMDQVIPQNSTPDPDAYTVTDYDGNAVEGLVFTGVKVVVTENEYSGEEELTVEISDTVTIMKDGEDVTACYEVEASYETGSIQRTCENSTFTDNGFCSVCSSNTCEVYQPATDADNDGVYEIANAGQLYWFAQQVNEYGQTNAGAKLMNNITIPTGTPNWTPINYYYATFDGQFHTISGLNCESSAGYVGFMGNSGYGCSVKNLHITNSTFKGLDGAQYVGAIAASVGAGLENCYVDSSVTIEGGVYNGLLAGYHGNGGTVVNCYAPGKLVGSGSSTFENCYYIGEDDGYDGTTAVTIEQMKSGEVAYHLQSGIVGEEVYDEETDSWVTQAPDEVWGQTIGTEDYPVFGGAKVYQKQNCNGETLYRNIDEDVTHNYGELIPATEEVHTETELKAAVAAHYYCSECQGYFTENYTPTTLDELTGEVPTHNYDTWQPSSIQHRKKCECGAKTEWVYHTFDPTTHYCECGFMERIISVDITWGEMEFTYDDTLDEEGNEKGWTCADGANMITIENNSNDTVRVSFDYEQLMYTEIEGSFTDGTKAVTWVGLGIDENNKTKTVYFNLNGKPSEALEYGIIGTITLTIE